MGPDFNWPCYWLLMMIPLYLYRWFGVHPRDVPPSISLQSVSTNDNQLVDRPPQTGLDTRTASPLVGQNPNHFPVLEEQSETKHSDEFFGVCEWREWWEVQWIVADDQLFYKTSLRMPGMPHKLVPFSNNRDLVPLETYISHLYFKLCHDPKRMS